MQNELIRNHYDAFDRIAAFGVKYSSRFAATTRAPQWFASIQQVVREMENLGITQLTASDHYHRGTSAKQMAVELVREDLRAIRETAVSIALADNEPDFSKVFLMPKSYSQMVLLTRAKTVLEAATPHAARFVEFEMPADFLTQLTENIARLEVADDDQNAGLSTRIGGTAGLGTQVVMGLRLRRQLVPVVRNKFKANASILAEWESAVRVVRARRGRDEAASPVPAGG